mgnify:CR=1 FL=1
MVLQTKHVDDLDDEVTDCGDREENRDGLGEPVAVIELLLEGQDVGRFDCEHVEDLEETTEKVRELFAEGGLFHWVSVLLYGVLKIKKCYFFAFCLEFFRFFR